MDRQHTRVEDRQNTIMCRPWWMGTLATGLLWLNRDTLPSTTLEDITDYPVLPFQPRLWEPDWCWDFDTTIYDYLLPMLCCY